MEDRYSSEFINNFLKRFEVDEGNKPSPQQMGIQEQGGGGDATKSAETGQEAGADKTQQSKERWTTRIAAAKERVKSAGSQTREVGKSVTAKIKELTSKGGGEENKKYMKDRVSDAKDRATGVKNFFSKENLLKNYDGIAEKAVDAKNAVLTRTEEAAKGVLHKANEKLVTKPQEATKNYGPDVGRYFMNQGKTVVDGINADAYGFKADVNQYIADKYDAKADRRVRKENNLLAKIDDANADGRDRKTSRLQKKLERVAERRGKIEGKYEKYKSRAEKARSAATDLRTGIAERNRQPVQATQ